MEIKQINLDDIKEYKKNTKKHPKNQIEKIKKSIESFGFNVPLVLDNGNTIISGHGRFLAAKELNLKTVPVIYKTDLTEEQIKAYRIADNKVAESEWDFDYLTEEFKFLKEKGFDWDLTGFDSKEIKAFMPEEEIIDDGLVLVDAYERAKKNCKIKKGDIFILGNHRLMCGDSTSESDVNSLMDKQMADMVFTDPPYNIGYEYEEWDDKLTPEEYSEWCKKWMKLLRANSKGNIISTIGHANIGMWYHIDTPLAMASWIKKNAVSGSKISKCCIWEPLLFFGDFKNNKRDFDVFEYNLKRQDIGETGKEHSCPRQLLMISDIIKSYSITESLWLDLFGGSGTTLIAAEQLNRRCFMMELNPIYCQVIIDRWEKFTSKKSTKVNND